VAEPAQAKKFEDLLLMKVFGYGLLTARRRNSALIPWRKIRDRSETLAWAIFAQQDLVRKRECWRGYETRHGQLRFGGIVIEFSYRI